MKIMKYSFKKGRNLLSNSNTTVIGNATEEPSFSELAEGNLSSISKVAVIGSDSEISPLK